MSPIWTCIISEIVWDYWSFIDHLGNALQMSACYSVECNAVNAYSGPQLMVDMMYPGCTCKITRITDIRLLTAWTEIDAESSSISGKPSDKYRLQLGKAGDEYYSIRFNRSRGIVYGRTRVSSRVSGSTTHIAFAITYCVYSRGDFTLAQMPEILTPLDDTLSSFPFF